jgi:CubicO group peptidase (beta-lactamase class C family)
MKKTALFCLFFLQNYFFFAQTSYFPPIIGNSWETTTPASLDWCVNKISPFYAYLEQTNTKGFIVLKDGKIVMEKYFGTFTQDSLWYWASAGKTMTSTLIGIAQDEGKLSIQDKSTKYLGKNWTSLAPDKEDLITIRHQLTMTTGLDDNGDCTDAACLKYKADAGTRWAYHNAPYTILDNVVEKASGMTFNQYYKVKVQSKIGMNGQFVKLGYNNVNFSTVRSMARFGLLILNKGKWQNTQIISQKYLEEATTTSQNINNSYGYLWWLNGKSSYMLPTLQLTFPGSLAKDAPKDMYSALGKNGQIINIVPSMGLVMIRMGNADGSPVPTTYNNSIWQKFNEIILCEPTSNQENTVQNDIHIFPNPAHDRIFIESKFDLQQADIQIFNRFGEKQNVVLKNNFIETNAFQNGFYFIKIKTGTQEIVKRFLVF